MAVKEAQAGEADAVLYLQHPKRGRL